MKTGIASAPRRAKAIPEPRKRVQLGGMAFGSHYGPIESSKGIQLLRQAIDLGVTLFDTSPAFGGGKAEELLGRALGPHQHNVQIATKALPSSTREVDQGKSDRETLLDCLEASLRRLKRDYIDLYYIQPDAGKAAIGSLVEAMELVRESGLIRLVGLVATSSYPLRLALKAGRIDAVLVPYNILNRPIDTEFLSFCKQSNVAVHAAEPLCRGLLTGRLHKNSTFEAADIRTRDKRFRGERFRSNIDIVQNLGIYATQEGLSLLELSLGWVLQHPSVSTAICGARSIRQIEEINRASHAQLSLDQILSIDFIVGRNKFQKIEY